MRKSIFSKTLEDELNEAKSILGFNDFQLSKFLEVSEETLKRLSPLETHFLTREQHDQEDYKKISKISDVLSPLKNFKFHKMTADDILGVYNEFHKVGDSLYNFKHLLQHDRFSSEEGRLAAQISEERCFSFFKHYTIGDGADELQKLNVRIIQEFFKKSIDIKDKWIYGDGGDYTVLEAQYLEESHPDEGEFWEKVPLFSTQIEEAWKLVTVLSQKGVQIRLSNKAMNDKYWWCYLTTDSGYVICAQADSAPEAICRSILDYCSKSK